MNPKKRARMERALARREADRLKYDEILKDLDSLSALEKDALYTKRNKAAAEIITLKERLGVAK